MPTHLELKIAAENFKAFHISIRSEIHLITCEAVEKRFIDFQALNCLQKICSFVVTIG